MKAYIVLEDIYEAYVFSAEKIFIDIFLKEEDAKAKVEELSEPYNDVYYEEVEIK